jgi:hypothetical protein
MEREQSNKQDNQQSLHGSGSAENKGQDRSAQKNRSTNISQQDRQNLAAQIGKGPNRIADIEDLGGMSGRDDSSGGSGDHMEDQSSDQKTDRF